MTSSMRLSIRIVARISKNDYTIGMTISSLIITAFRRFFQRKPVLFALATILLHILFIQSTAWKEWLPSQNIKTLETLEVQLRPVTPTKEIALKNEVSPKAAQAKVHTKRPMSPIPQKNEQQEKTTPIMETPIETISNEAIVKEAADAVSMPPDEKISETDFSLRIPESVEMQLEVVQTKVNGNSTSGVGSINWNTKDEKYKISIEAGLNLLVTTLNLYTLTSEGVIDTYGITPTISTEKRRGRPETAIHFNHLDKTILFSSTNKIVELENGVQDMASVLFQLSAIAYANPAQLLIGREIMIQVADGRDAAQFTFQVLGEEEIDSKLNPSTGKIMAVHLSRPPKPGSYNSQLDIWFSPSHAWYPIQIKNTESNGTVTSQTVIKLKQNTNQTNSSVN
jgi:hypothetical protein